MVNILLTGVGGQGTVLAAKVLAMAAASKGWHVRTAETIGMAQRGGSVVSHVRMGNLGEEVYAPLITHGTANMIIAFEPGEAARNLSYLAPDGVVVTAQSTVEPVTASLSSEPYNSDEIIEGIQRTFYNRHARDLLHSDQADATKPRSRQRLISVDDEAIIDVLGGNRKVLNSALLAVAVSQSALPLTIDDLRGAIAACVKPQFVEMNLKAIDAVAREVRG